MAAVLRLPRFSTIGRFLLTCSAEEGVERLEVTAPGPDEEKRRATVTAYAPAAVAAIVQLTSVD